jgi:hypothetical protein
MATEAGVGVAGFGVFGLVLNFGDARAAKGSLFADPAVLAGGCANAGNEG